MKQKRYNGNRERNQKNGYSDMPAEMIAKMTHGCVNDQPE
jgi:hypothetical protein